MKVYHHQTIGVSRFIYNFYIDHNKEVYEKEKKFVSGMNFSKWLNNEYIPLNSIVKSGTVSQKSDRYYVSILVEENVKINNKPYSKGVGVDLGLKDFAICSNGITKKNINKTSAVKKSEKKLKREQRKLSRKYESSKVRSKNIKKEGGNATRQNIQKQIVKVQKLHQKLANKRTDYINKTVSELIKQKPSFITIEDLNVSGMMKNRHLAKAVAQQKL